MSFVTVSSPTLPASSCSDSDSYSGKKSSFLPFDFREIETIRIISKIVMTEIVVIILTIIRTPLFHIKKSLTDWLKTFIGCGGRI